MTPRALVVGTLALVATAVGVTVSGQSASGPLPGRSAASTPSAELVSTPAAAGALLEQVLHHLPQRAREGRGPGLIAQARARRARPGTRRRGRRGVGARHPQVARRHDASCRVPASAQGRVRLVDVVDRARARSQRDALHAGAGTASPQPDRVRQRRARSPGRGGRSGAVSAVRRFDVRVRQHRRCPRPLVDPRGGLRLRGAEAQPAGPRQARVAHARRLPRARGHHAGLSRRGPAVRDARGNRGQACVPLGWRVHRDGDADLRRQHVAGGLWIRAMREGRDPARRRAAGVARLAGRRPGSGSQLRRPRPGRDAKWTGRPRSVLRRSRRAADARSLPGNGGPARRRRDVSANEPGAGSRSRQALHAVHAADGADAGYTFFPHVGTLRIEGPFDAVPAQDSPSRRRIFTCRPAAPGRRVREDHHCRARHAGRSGVLRRRPMSTC